MDSFWSASPLRDNDLAELGIAELAKGNYVTAEGHFQQALKRNGKDVHALLGAGIAMYGGGLTGSAVVSAAGSGALGGFFAGENSKRALYMGGGALVAATIANFAGVPGPAVVSAAGTGTLIGFLLA